jgi:hypothetical protein
MTVIKPGYLTLAGTALMLGVGTAAVMSAWWKFLLLLALLAACTAVPILHTVAGPAEGSR